MRILLALVLVTAGIPVAHAEPPHHKLECPQTAPADWRMPQARLSGVEVLSAKVGEAIDDKSPPSLVPDDQSLSAGTLHQSWRMDSDGPGWVRFVDCHYQGTDRVLRLDANHLVRCERTLTHFSKTAEANEPSIDQMTCD